jgi:voltage-gated potassium channel
VSDRTRCQTAWVNALREEVGRLRSYGERHRRLFARLTLIVIATAMLDLIAAGAMYLLERDAKGTEIRTFGQAAFFTTVQLLTVSSQIKNPLTPAGRAIDIALELWAVVVVAGSAGAIASFFQSSD